MKVFYTASSQFRESDSEVYKKVVNYLGFKVGQKNVKFPTSKPATNSVADLNKVVRSVHDDEKHIREADAVVAEISQGSSAIGFHVALALVEKKPILVIRSKTDEKPTVYGPYSSGAHKNIVYKEYGNTEELTQIVDKFLEDAKQKIDTKFILILPREIDKYLSWSSDFRRMHKAQVVREALEGVMKKDKDWKHYQKQLS